MNCRPFIIADSGDMLCGGADVSVIGNARRPPAGLSEEQFNQIAHWVSLKALADAVAPIFTVVSMGPTQLDAAVRLRAAAKFKKVVEQIDESLVALEQDMRDVGGQTGLGWTAKLTRTALRDSKGSYVVWEIAVITDPTRVALRILRPALQELARVMNDTRLGEHLMDPKAPWIPEQLGRRRRS